MKSINLTGVHPKRMTQSPITWKTRHQNFIEPESYSFLNKQQIQTSENLIAIHLEGRILKPEIGIHH